MRYARAPRSPGPDARDQRADAVLATTSASADACRASASLQSVAEKCSCSHPSLVRRHSPTFRCTGANHSFKACLGVAATGEGTENGCIDARSSIGLDPNAALLWRSDDAG